MFKTDIDKIFIVIPAKDEERFIEHVINNTLKIGFKNIVVVNDNSSDNTKATVHAHDEDIVVLDHLINLGAGAATKTGIDYAL